LADDNFRATSFQRQRRGQAADAAADDRNTWRARHSRLFNCRRLAALKIVMGACALDTTGMRASGKPVGVYGRPILVFTTEKGSMTSPARTRESSARSATKAGEATRLRTSASPRKRTIIRRSRQVRFISQ